MFIFFACLVTCFMLFGECSAEQNKIKSYDNISCMARSTDGSNYVILIDEDGNEVADDDTAITAVEAEIKPADGYKILDVFIADVKIDESYLLLPTSLSNLQYRSVMDELVTDDPPVSVYRLPPEFVNEEHSIIAVFVPEEGTPYEWTTEPWGNCFDGKQERSVLCMSKTTDDDGRRSTNLDGMFCAGAKPDSIQNCNDTSDSDSGGGGGCFIATLFDE